MVKSQDGNMMIPPVNSILEEKKKSSTVDYFRWVDFVVVVRTIQMEILSDTCSLKKAARSECRSFPS